MKLFTQSLIALFLCSQAHALSYYTATCEGGPVMAGSASSIGQCQPNPSVHVSSAYDLARNCATGKARLECAMAGNTQCEVLNEINNGWVPATTFGYVNCSVQVIVVGD